MTHGKLKDNDEFFVFVGRTSQVANGIETFEESHYEMLAEIGRG